MASQAPAKGFARLQIPCTSTADSILQKHVRNSSSWLCETIVWHRQWTPTLARWENLSRQSVQLYALIREQGIQ